MPVVTRKGYGTSVGLFERALGENPKTTTDRRKIHEAVKERRKKAAEEKKEEEKEAEKRSMNEAMEQITEQYKRELAATLMKKGEFSTIEDAKRYINEACDEDTSFCRKVGPYIAAAALGTGALAVAYGMKKKKTKKKKTKKKKSKKEKSKKKKSRSRSK